MFSTYIFSNSNFFIIFFWTYFLKISFWKSKLILKLFFYFFLSIYLYIYYNPKFHILKTLPHPSTLNPKSRLVDPNIINVFYPSLKVMVKIVSVNMKSCIINVVFLTISLISLVVINTNMSILNYILDSDPPFKRAGIFFI